MASFGDRIGGFTRYLRAAIALAVGIAILYWPGNVGSGDQNQLFILLGGTIAFIALGWMFLTFDRAVSDNPRYQRPVYTEDDEDAA